MRQPCGEKESFWHFVLSEHGESGMSVSEFCRLEGVSQASFYQWRKKLASPAATVTTESTSDASTSLASILPVEVVPSANRNTAADQWPSAQAGSTAVSLTIRTPQGYAIDVSGNTSPDVLRCSLGALKQLAETQS